MPDTSAQTDRELLELAAKAADLRIADWAGNVPMVLSIGRTLEFEWNPLTDDGDALRLAVKLNLTVAVDAETAGTISVCWDFDASGNANKAVEENAPIGGDDYAATRRAIVRAAAQIIG